eukprot:COSAG01_NODE_1474_length_10192_cov_7.027742_2_plen_2062_part_00
MGCGVSTRQRRDRVYPVTGGYDRVVHVKRNGDGPAKKSGREGDAAPRQSSAPPQGHPLPVARTGPLNAPGHWDAMVSYTQRHSGAKLLASEVYSGLRERGRTTWLDVKMAKLNEAAMQEAAQNSRCIVAVITGVERPGDPAENAYFLREYCVNELRWARAAGVPIQPVILPEDKSKVGEFLGQAPADLKDLGAVDFIHLDRSRAAYWKAGVDELIQSMDDLVAQNATELELEPELDTTTVSAQRGFCFHVTMQMPRMLVDGRVEQVRLHEQLRGMEAFLRKRTIQAPYEARRQVPICLSDAASVSNTVHEHLRGGLIHCLVWCGRGFGWEPRKDRTDRDLQSIFTIADEVTRCPRKAPRVAVVCLQYGARYAAEYLSEAGIPTVMWLAVDMLQESCKHVFGRVIAPTVEYLEARHTIDEVLAFLRDKLAEVVALKSCANVCSAAIADACGVSSLAPKPIKWEPMAVREEEIKGDDWLCNLIPPKSLCPTQSCLQQKTLKNLDLLACDVHMVQKLQAQLRGDDGQNVMLQYTEAHDTIEHPVLRMRSIALEACKSGTYEQVHHVRTREQLRAALESCVDDSDNLIWLDITVESCDRQTVDEMQHNLAEYLDQAVVCDLILTSDNAHLVETLQSDLNFMHLSIGRETGLSGVYADKLHDEFKLLSSGGEESSSLCLLDVFEPQRLAESLSKTLSETSLDKNELVERHVVALYRGNEQGVCLFRVCVSDVAFLHVLRDNFLSARFDRDLERKLQQLPCLPGYEDVRAGIKIAIDATHFADTYEKSILCLDKLTPHQRHALAECQESTRGLHINGPAGSGKTFVALHFLMGVLSNTGTCVLIIAKNQPLALFVAKWIAHRLRSDKWGDSKLKQALSRVHLLFEPFSQGPRVAVVEGSSLQYRPVSAHKNYDLMVVDEAHHVWLDEHLRTAVERFNCTRRMLLSDASQGLHDGLDFPDDLHEIELTEIVRSSKRVISAAMEFQLHNEILLKEVPCHHGSDGPPLKSFIFDVVSGNPHAEYALQTLKAVRSVHAKFPGLNLHNRLAIIVPDSDFRMQLAAPLEQQLEEAFPQQFQLVDSTIASSHCDFAGTVASPDKQVVMLDEMTQMDGMEWLIVICVGLDSARQDVESDIEFAKTRSMLYRGVTRAHMMVIVVNEFIAGGWLAFLTTVRLNEHEKFDSKRTIEAAELSRQQNEKRNAAAAKRDTELTAQADSAILAMQEIRPRGEEETMYLKRRILALLRRGNDRSQAVAAAEDEWRKRCEVQQAQLDRQIELDKFMDSYVTKFPLADDERSFVRRHLLSEDAPTSAAATEARRSWPTDQLRKQVPAVVAANAGKMGITGQRSLAAIENATLKKLSPDEYAIWHVEAAVGTALAEWQQIEAELYEAAATEARRSWATEQLRKQVPAVVAATAGKMGITGQRSLAAIENATSEKLSPDDTVESAVEIALAEWRQIEAELYKAAAAQSLECDNWEKQKVEIAASLVRGVSMQIAVKQVLSKMRTEQRIASALEFLRSETRGWPLDSDGKRCLETTVRQAILDDKAKTAAVAVSDALREWQAIEDLLAVQARLRKLGSATHQSSWIKVARLVRRYHAVNGRQTPQQVVSTEVDAWQEQQRRNREMQKTVQSVWDASENQSIWTAVVTFTLASGSTITDAMGAGHPLSQVIGTEAAVGVLMSDVAAGASTFDVRVTSKATFTNATGAAKVEFTAFSANDLAVAAIKTISPRDPRKWRRERVEKDDADDSLELPRKLRRHAAARTIQKHQRGYSTRTRLKAAQVERASRGEHSVEKDDADDSLERTSSLDQLMQERQVKLEQMSIAQLEKVARAPLFGISETALSAAKEDKSALVHLIYNSELRIRLQRATDVRKRVKDLKQTQQEMDEDDEKRKQAKKRELKMKSGLEPEPELELELENEAEQRRKTQDRLLARRNSQLKDVLNCVVQELFSEFDTDGSEHNDSDELAAMLKELDAQIADGRLDVSSADIGSLVEKIDTNDDGLISREELRQYLVHMGLDKKQRPRAASRATKITLHKEATGIQSSRAAQENFDDAVNKWLWAASDSDE